MSSADTDDRVFAVTPTDAKGKPITQTPVYGGVDFGAGKRGNAANGGIDPDNAFYDPLGDDPFITRVSVDQQSLRDTLEHDYASFLLLFLAEEEGIEHGVPLFHEYVMGIMCGRSPRVCIAMPRDHAKTTLAKLSAVWHFIYTPTRFLVYVSNTSTIAASATKDIVNFICSPACVAVYGEPVFSQREESKGNFTFDWCGKTVIVRALGAVQQVRGMNVDNKRPDLAVVDDIESSEELDTNKLGYEKLKKWFYTTFRKALDQRRNKIVQIGNLVSNRSILNDHLKSPNWNSVRLGAFTADGKVLWPARWTLEALRTDMLEYAKEGQLLGWLAEMLNMPMTSSTGLLPGTGMKLVQRINPGDQNILLRCITVDPAITSNMMHADSAVVTVHGYVQRPDGEVAWQRLDWLSARGVGPYDLFAMIMEMAQKWNVRTVGVENTGYQQALIHVCKHESAKLGYKSMNFVPLIAQGASKHVRIIAWANMIKKGLYCLTMADMPLWRQLQEYDITTTRNKDDEIDCAAYILQMISLYRDQMTEYMHGAVIDAEGMTPRSHSAYI